MANSLAGKVRRCSESDEFDLAGFDQAKCDEFCKLAFADPFPLAQMVRISFVVGGGKLVRQKYSDDLPKMFMNSMTGVGYQDDISADCSASSGGKFKFQHDTGKNLKFVHVFPKLSPKEAGGKQEEEAEAAEERPATPAEIFFRCDEKLFERLLNERLPTYSQKRKLLDLLKERIAALEAVEAKMGALQRLTDEEQAIYDEVGVDTLREKAKAVSAALQKMVDEGGLAAAERDSFLEQLEGKLEAAQGELAKAEEEGKSKKAAALKQALESMTRTRAAVKEATPVPLPPLKHANDIRKLRGKLRELDRIEKMSKGHYTLEELKILGERPEIEEALAVYEARSRGWLEDDEVFQKRLDSCIAAGASSTKKASGGSSSGSAWGGAGSRPTSSGSGGFTTVSGGARTSKAKASAPRTSNAFSALG